MLHWGDRSRLAHWPAFSNAVIKHYGRGPFVEPEKVDEILRFGFKHMLTTFCSLTEGKRNLSFYKAIAGLYERLSKIMDHVNRNEPLQNIEEHDFVTNRNAGQSLVETEQFVDFFDAISYAGFVQLGGNHGSAAILERHYHQRNHHSGAWACVGNGGL